MRFKRRVGAPSEALRNWFDHDPDRWKEHRHRYLHELSRNDARVGESLAWCRKRAVILLFAAKDRDRNEADVLQAYPTCRQKEETECSGPLTPVCCDCCTARPMHPAVHASISAQRYPGASQLSGVIWIPCSVRITSRAISWGCG
ncbi:DUF488 domain-containing protein [Sedimentitalea todarodis]|uniref:DUF488 domain-containing protein n=1 Tax=Sedimentitalea todarodis TaxID=1631240 RepID=UPI00374317EA